jgi:hypothetical protein
MSAQQSPSRALLVMQRILVEMDLVEEENTCWEDLLLATTKQQDDGQGDDTISWTTVATSYIVAIMAMIAAILLLVQVYRTTQKDKAVKQQQAALKHRNKNKVMNMNSNSMNTKMMFDDINSKHQTSDIFNPNDMVMKNSSDDIQVQATSTADEDDDESAFPHLIASLEDLENYDAHDPLARNWQMVYFTQMRRKALSWYFAWVTLAYLLDALRHQAVQIGIGSSGQEWLIRTYYLLSMIAFPGMVIGVLSNRVLSGIDEQSGEPHKKTEQQRLTQQRCHGSALAGILAVFTAVAIVTLLLPLEDASWVFGLVWLAWTGLLLALTLITSGCICTDGFVFGEVDIVPTPTSLTAISSLLFSVGQFLLVTSFCMNAILTPICSWSHTTTTTTATQEPPQEQEDSIAVNAGDSSDLSFMATNCFASASCPLPDSFPPTALANLIVYMGFGVILVGGLLLPKP